MNNTPWERVAAEKLQMSVRIAQLEAQLAATSSAWGPPQAQPDSDGWWAYQGKNMETVFEVWRNFRDGGFWVADGRIDGSPAKRYVGKWWRLHMPWEANS